MLEKLIGRTIVEVRKTDDDDFGWDQPGTVIVLDDGTEIIPSCDPEGNATGHLFIFTNEGQQQ